MNLRTSFLFPFCQKTLCSAPGPLPNIPADHTRFIAKITFFTVYEASLVIKPSLPFLGASPDGKVFDPLDRDPFGFLK